MRHSFTSLIAAVCVGGTALGGELAFSVRGARTEAIADAVVSLVPLDPGVLLPEPQPAELAQREQEYSAYVTVIQAGGRIAFPNHDTVQHHVYSLSKTKKFELPLYNPGAAESLVFDVSGVVTLGCNIHDWMLAYVIVVPTPYFAKSDDLGLGRITAPAGHYRLELWHPRLASPVKQEITLAADGSVAQDFVVTLKPDRRIRRGPETKGGGYR